MRITLAQGPQIFYRAGALDYFDALADHVLDIAWCWVVGVVRQDRLEHLIGRTKLELLHAVGGDRQASSGQVCLVAPQRRQDLVEGLTIDITHFHAQLGSEHLHQVVFQPGRLALRVDIARGGRITGQYHQFACL